MSMWDRLRKGTQTVSEKSGELLEMAQTRAAITKLETEKIRKFTELGELTYRVYNREDVADAEMERLCDEIRELDRELEAHRERLEGDTLVCPGCSRPVKPEARYCSECGQSLRPVRP
jgi:DNA repair exonuclease SbcCD ATPase subunit